MNFPNLFQNSLSFLDNKYVSASVSLFLVLYAGMAAPELPEGVARLFEHKLFRIFIFFLISVCYMIEETQTVIRSITEKLTKFCKWKRLHFTLKNIRKSYS